MEVELLAGMVVVLLLNREAVEIGNKEDMVEALEQEVLEGMVLLSNSNNSMVAHRIMLVGMVVVVLVNMVDMEDFRGSYFLQNPLKER